MFFSLVFFLIAATHLIEQQITLRQEISPACCSSAHIFFDNRPVDEGGVHTQAVLSAGGRPPPREDTKIGCWGRASSSVHAQRVSILAPPRACTQKRCSPRAVAGLRGRSLVDIKKVGSFECLFTKKRLYRYSKKRLRRVSTPDPWL